MSIGGLAAPCPGEIFAASRWFVLNAYSDVLNGAVVPAATR
jgi:hypothetical protein